MDSPVYDEPYCSLGMAHSNGPHNVEMDQGRLGCWRIQDPSRGFPQEYDAAYSSGSDLDSYETGTVRRRTKTIVTPKMAMESFRLSFLNDDQDVNFDAILGELYELESQLNSTQSELSRTLEGTASTSSSSCSHHPPPPAGFQDEGVGDHSGSSDTLHVTEQEELDQLAAEISRGLPFHRTNGHSSSSSTSSSSSSQPYHHHHSHHTHHSHHHHPHHHQHHNQHLTIGGVPTPHGGPFPGGGEGMSDAAETDSAFSDNASLPSSESFTSMATVSSSADTTSSSSGETCSMTSAGCGLPHSEEEQIARAKAEKIRIALEKIREAKIRKLFVRAFAKDGSSKSILVDEKMSVSQVCSQLADKNHVRLNHKLAVVEHMPELLMERILEDHDSLVESMVMWTRDSKNKIMFEDRMDKYDLFRNPEKYLMNLSGSKQGPLSASQKDKLIQEFFAPESVCVPMMEGALYLKSDGKKAWKKFFFVLRASGLYYNPKGKASKNPKDLACLVQFDYVEVYRGLGWKKKYHAPTDFCFALKHPQIQKKTSKYIRYFCAETEMALDQWVMGIRTVKLGKQMLHNYERLTHEISMWDLRLPEPGAVAADEGLCQMLNHADLSDSRMSVPEPGSRHSVIQVHNASLVRNPSSAGSSGGVSNSSSKDVLSIEVLAMPSRKGSESGIASDGRSLSGSVSSGMSSESGHKTPVKRVSFSATHSIINGDSGEQIVKHRDSIISASTDSSDDSNSSGETRASFRGKMRPRLPLTTETTRQLADMCNVTMDETAEAIYAETHHRGTSSLSSSSTSSAFARSDRRRASMQERRGSCGSGNSESSQRHGHIGRSAIKQSSLDSSGESTLTRNRHHSPAISEGQYTHVRRKSEPSVTDLISMGKEDATYTPVYVPVTDDNKVPNGSQYSRLGQELEPLYNQIRNVGTKQSVQASSDSYSAIAPPPLQFGEDRNQESHIPPPLPPPLHMDHEPSPPLPPPPTHLQHMQVPPPPPPISTSSISQHQLIHKQQGPILPSSPASPAPSQSHAKSPPPATLPKPSGNISSSIAKSNSSPPITSDNSAPAVKSSNTPSAQTSLPKQAPPPPPLRLCSTDSTSSLSGVDSITGSPLHIPMPPPMPPLNPKLPPPTLPKTSSQRPGPPPPPPPPPPPSGPADTTHLSRLNSNQHGIGLVNPAVAAEMPGCPPQSPSLPFLSELTKRNQPDIGHGSTISGGDGMDARAGQPAAPNQHRRSSSTGGNGSMKVQKAVPPPPPKRSESTRLSGDVAQKSALHSPPPPDSVTNGSHAIHDPIYENYDGMMDIDELPPPPPELLMDLAPSESSEQRTAGPGKKAKPPPPPPKRSKETHLSSH
ncbi:ras-associated and pleckstrin homology domains-containing protein 1 [Plakobranchus ocellatus]|uniref:Ras-associated and pleckstrin homology domains-containing protein 1 n=1 Tax=Plakobranchus ocellatus TaxID=259542 RepID=A0AAV4D1P6_9GAST|nr:ras-associated and pleckstrin homology domains-containing protein 1 [Plakobranchus ocellatus]